MNIGFDVTQTGPQKAGCGYFAESLINHLAIWDSNNNYTLYTSFGDHFWCGDKDKSYFNLPNFKHGIAHADHAEALSFWCNLPLNYEEHLGDPDIIHANNFYCPKKLQYAKLVYTLYDLSFLEVLECSTEHNRIGCFEGVFNASLLADFIIAISSHTKDHFLRIFPHYPKDRIKVVYPGCRFAVSSSQEKLYSKKLRQLQPQKFWLNVGTIEPRKNLKRLLKAYAKLIQKKITDFPLIIAGSSGWKVDIDKTINDLQLNRHVFVLGYVNDSEMEWLYKNCFCLMYPSLFEGFGMPVLEAIYFNAPVIASKVSSLPEVVGDAGILVDPLREDEIENAMKSLVLNSDLRTQYVIRTKKQANLFSWDKTAKTVLDLYKEVNKLPYYAKKDFDYQYLKTLIA